MYKNNVFGTLKYYDYYNFSLNVIISCEIQFYAVKHEHVSIYYISYNMF